MRTGQERTQGNERGKIKEEEETRKQKRERRRGRKARWRREEAVGEQTRGNGKEDKRGEKREAEHKAWVRKKEEIRRRGNKEM